ncbi:MAG: T9SS type A sorting domain-containing protein [Bacteroidales bacterium]|nr:T9SS type A sorting domain-containing protein [Bacteroidales bacterium]
MIRLPHAHKIILLLIIIFCQPLYSQMITTVTHIDNTLPDLEPTPYTYNFDYPIHSDILTNVPTKPSLSKRYQTSLFGPRYKTTSGSNTTTYDFHQGEDISGDFTYGGKTYTTDTTLILPDSSNIAREYCMCDGVVDNVIDGTNAAMNLIETGRSVRIKCNEQFNGNTHNPAWENIYIAYRHLSKIVVALGDSIRKGDSIGWMGNSGYTTNIHLHLSLQRKIGYSFENIHPMRIFSPTAITHLHQPLQTAYIEHIHSWTDSAAFRISIPRTQMCIKRIRVRYSNIIDYTFDFESVSMDNNRDNHNLIPGLSVLAYNLNRAASAYSRFNATSAAMPVFYPASPNRNLADGIFPITNSSPYNDQQVVATFDLIVRSLPLNFDYNNVLIDISDIYGNVVSTSNITTEINKPIASPQISIFPNPFKTTTTLKLDAEMSDAQLRLYSIYGQSVKETTPNNPILLSRDNLPAGIYLLRVAKEDQTLITKKIIIED